MLAKSVIEKVVLARRLLNLACQQARGGQSTSMCVTAILLQDSVETLLLAMAEHKNVQLRERTAFPQYLDKIDEAIGPPALPFRPRLMDLNSIRVNAKHRGIAPDGREIEGLVIVVREFFEEACQRVLGQPLSALNLISLLKDGEDREFLHSAEQALQRGDSRGCLTECRKAFFVAFEARYDISAFETEVHGQLATAYLSQAPWYARNSKYIAENVTCPTDYIVFDHQQLELELVKSDIDTVMFWNVWRLTPAVYRRPKQDQWIVKWDVGLDRDEGLQSRAEYALDSITSLLLQLQEHRGSALSAGMGFRLVNLREAEVPVYEKPDLQSTRVGTTPPGLLAIDVSYKVEGLPDGVFWRVFHEEGRLLEGGALTIGFIQGCYVDSGAPPDPGSTHQSCS